MRLVRHFTALVIVALSAVDALAQDCRSTGQGPYPFVLPAGYVHNRFVASVGRGETAVNYGGFVAVFDQGDDDNGDGVGREKVESGEGLLARATYLDSLSVDEAAASVATGKLLKERARLEGEIEQLIARKTSMNDVEYEANLERLFIELAKVNRSIKQAGS